MFLLACLGHGEAVQCGGRAVAAGVRHPGCQAFLPAHRLSDLEAYSLGEGSMSHWRRVCTGASPPGSICFEGGGEAVQKEMLCVMVVMETRGGSHLCG